MATDEFAQRPGDTSDQEVASSESVVSPLQEKRNEAQQPRPWYSFVNEDWLATIVGLILALLIVIRLFHNIP